VLETAWAVKEAGATILRGGAFKPRTSPYSFQGMGEKGLQILAEAREQTGLPIITEVMTVETVPMVCEYADILQIGARNMQNYGLLQAVGKVQKPVMLKRGISGEIKELLMCAEYILSNGNMQVMLCERGIRTYETATRNTFDLNAVPVLQKLSHLPVVADPSHGTGARDLVGADVSRCRGRGRGCAHPGSSSRPGQSRERWRAELAAGAVRRVDGPVAADRPSCGPIHCHPDGSNGEQAAGVERFFQSPISRSLNLLVSKVSRLGD
jgi:hypothetical protein